MYVINVIALTNFGHVAGYSLCSDPLGARCLNYSSRPTMFQLWHMGWMLYLEPTVAFPGNGAALWKRVWSYLVVTPQHTSCQW